MKTKFYLRFWPSEAVEVWKVKVADHGNGMCTIYRNGIGTGGVHISECYGTILEMDISVIGDIQDLEKKIGKEKAKKVYMAYLKVRDKIALTQLSLKLEEE